MELVFSNFDLYLSAFRLTIGLFLVSAWGRSCWGPCWRRCGSGRSRHAKAATVYITVVRNTPLLMIFVFVIFGLPEAGHPFRSIEELGDQLFFFRACLGADAVHLDVRRRGDPVRHQRGPLGQAEAARAIGLTFGGTMTQVVLPQAFRATVPPLASVLIALLKNTSVAYAFGILEATARMKYFTNVGAQRACRLPASRSATSSSSRSLVRRQPARASLEGGAMSQTSVLFDVPGPRTRARHRIYTVIALVVIPAWSRLVLRFDAPGQFAYALWEPFLTPDYIRALLVDGLLDTLRMAFFSVILAVVFGASSASASSPTTPRARGCAGRWWSSSAPCPC